MNKSKIWNIVLAFVAIAALVLCVSTLGKNTSLMKERNDLFLENMTLTQKLEEAKKDIEEANAATKAVEEAAAAAGVNLGGAEDESSGESAGGSEEESAAETTEPAAETTEPAAEGESAGEPAAEGESAGESADAPAAN